MPRLDDIMGFRSIKGPSARAIMLLALVASALYGGGKANVKCKIENEKLKETQPQILHSTFSTFNSIGFVCVTNPAAVAGLCFNGEDHGWASFDATSNAVAKASWLATGVFDDYFTVTPATNAPVHLGTNEVRRLMVFSHGLVKAVLENGDAAYLEPFHAPMSFIAQHKWAECGGLTNVKLKM